VEQRRFTDGNTAWGYYTGTYTVPAGQTTTRFAFRSISAAGGNRSIGNFLDGIFFGTAAYVVLDKSAVPAGPLDVGDVVTYRITAKNEGGGAAENLTLTDNAWAYTRNTWYNYHRPHTGISGHPPASRVSNRPGQHT
ncbi:hypothetical protein ACWDE9_37310, partial [Streptomyces olivaceoviridis]